MRWITWQGSTVATLTAAANDGTGPWSVGPHKPADDPAAITEDLDAGRLDRHPDGGATLASVRARVAHERPEVR
jgi:hypothetical protein